MVREWEVTDKESRRISDAELPELTKMLIAEDALQRAVIRDLSGQVRALARHPGRMRGKMQSLRGEPRGRLERDGDARSETILLLRSPSASTNIQTTCCLAESCVYVLIRCPSIGCQKRPRYSLLDNVIPL